MKGIKFTLYYAVWCGSDYSDWSEVDGYFKYNDRINISILKDILSASSYSRFKLVISVQQTDYTDLVLYEHDRTNDKEAIFRTSYKVIDVITHYSENKAYKNVSVQYSVILKKE